MSLVLGFGPITKALSPRLPGRGDLMEEKCPEDEQTAPRTTDPGRDSKRGRQRRTCRCALTSEILIISRDLQNL